MAHENGHCRHRIFRVHRLEVQHCTLPRTKRSKKTPKQPWLNYDSRTTYRRFLVGFDDGDVMLEIGKHSEILHEVEHLRCACGSSQRHTGHVNLPETPPTAATARAAASISDYCCVFDGAPHPSWHPNVFRETPLRQAGSRGRRRGE